MDKEVCIRVDSFALQYFILFLPQRSPRYRCSSSLRYIRSLMLENRWQFFPLAIASPKTIERQVPRVQRHSEKHRS